MLFVAVDFGYFPVPSMENIILKLKIILHLLLIQIPGKFGNRLYTKLDLIANPLRAMLHPFSPFHQWMMGKSDKEQ
jgi:hypothetical protein